MIRLIFAFLLLISLPIAIKYKYPEAILVLITTSILLVFSVIFVLTANHRYKNIEAERNAIQWSLDQSRKHHRSLEATTILETTVEFNKRLAREKLDNTRWYAKEFISDKIDTLNFVE